MPTPTVLIIGTCDTKFDEILYLQEKIKEDSGCQTLILDVSHTQKNDARYVEQSDEIHAPCLGEGASLSKLPRGEFIDRSIELCLPIVKEMVEKQQIQGIVSAAGSSGSSLACALMRQACPIGFPKLMVSTMASGDIKPYIEETDITMMYSVVDIAGINSILKRILSNAASAISAMTASYAKTLEPTSPGAAGKRIGISMFGVTTPCVDHIRRMLTTTPHDMAAYEVYVFHATGSGGRAMERLVDEGQLDAVVDLTTTEIADELFGGVLTAGPDRLEIPAKKGIPYLVSVGACDMVNFGPKETVPEKYRDRNLYVHNPAVTLMRTTKENNHQIGKFIASQLKTHASDPSLVKVIIPEAGISMIDVAGKPFYDPEADEELFAALEDGLSGSGIGIEKIGEQINSEQFAAQVCRAILELMKVDPKTFRLANERRRQWSFDHGASIRRIRRESYVEIPDAAVD